MPSVTFNFTGDWQRWDVPTGLQIVDVVMTGGGANGVEAGRVAGKMRVSDDATLFIMVGERGRGATDGGFGLPGLNPSQGGSATFGGGGGGGDGHGARPGGGSGGGASAIRVGDRNGRIKAVAGGAGGQSGDNGSGGKGGGQTGQRGHRGNGGTGSTGHATGGSQSQGGEGGTSSLGSAYRGQQGDNDRLGRGGRGGQYAQTGTIGGGGGGGGYYPGGGGHAGKLNAAPGGGGAGGSNYIGNLFDETSNSNGGTGHGSVTISWGTGGGGGPGGGDDQLPGPVTDITINGVAAQDGLATKSIGNITVRARPHDPNQNQDLRVLIRYSASKSFNVHGTARGTYDSGTGKDTVVLTGLLPATQYYLRLYTQSSNGRISEQYTATNFWMNRPPNGPTLYLPPENAQIPSGTNVAFGWSHDDDDPNDSQTAYRLRWRKAGTPISDPGDWSTPIEGITDQQAATVGASELRSGLFYDWQVKTRDEAGTWGEWALASSFLYTANAAPPTLLDPINGQAYPASRPYMFRWKFFTGRVRNVGQVRFDIRYRAVGAVSWTTMLGTEGEPGINQYWILPAETFEEGVHYEWEGRSYNTEGDASDWSETANFWTTTTPGSGAGIVLVDSGRPADPLGQGVNRVFVFERGGTRVLGEITNFAVVRWTRVRDDISGCTVRLENLNETNRTLLSDLRTWMHELVIFRDDVRVWEGPVTRISGSQSTLEVEAKDVLAYLYRRIMRQGYNDSWRKISGVQIGQHTVVERAARIILNAMAYDDPNVLAYLTQIDSPTDAKNSRIRRDFSKTAWEEVDDLAATGGLDYTAVGRRIVLWDTHTPLGRLPELGNGDFSEPPLIAEYGMSAANVFAVTNGEGYYGLATRGFNGFDPGPQGFIEQLASAYGESEGSTSGQTLGREAIKEMVKNLHSQADRNISGRWPVPVIARVPDNSTLSPDVNLTINQLVPGVWVPLRAESGVRSISQWQKVDRISVEQAGEAEKISVVMGAAPNSGLDPDLDQALEDET